MSTSTLLWETLKKGRLIALLSPGSPEECVSAYETLAPLNVVLEIALRTKAALPGIAALRAKHPDALFMAGTVLTRGQAEQALDAGAAGIVSPDFFPEVVEACVQRDVLCMPGGIGDAGKQLALKAAGYGCEIEELRERYPYQWVYKLFPAMAAAPTFLEMAAGWKAVYSGMTVVYAGGVTAENLHQIVRHDPDGIVCGSALGRYAAQPEILAREARRWLDVIHGAEYRPASAASRPANAPSSDHPGHSVVAFGELMLRLSAPPGLRFNQTAALDATFGGAEANVAVALANWGVRARVVTALPEHAIGQAAIAALRAQGVDTRYVLRQGDRIGLYYLEHGAAQRPSQVVYDRAGSSITTIQPGQIDWAAAFKDADWFHWSGITPALGSSVAETLREALGAARQAGITVSADLNYRAKLWSREQAREVMAPLMQYVDLVICNEEDADNVFGIGPGAAEAARGRMNPEAYRQVAQQLVEKLGVKMAAITMRESLSASDNTWSACLFDGKDFHVSRRYSIHVVDRVGAGDAFAAGLIYGLLTDKDRRDALEFAVAASCWKHSILGDFNFATIAEVESLAAGDAAGRVRR
ncbi:MAG TPA: KHG/KDPG aldolase/sugar kinase fusion protein [Phycisphaerae bacterium]|nr:KHG/KDPG aldolase/sugar kinase fusion protein [Phycisphaerae bacterium]